MTHRLKLQTAALIVLLQLAISAGAAEPIPPIQRRLPPTDGIDVPADQRAELQSRHARLRSRLEKLEQHPAAVDIEVLLKSVDYALRHNEFYHPREIPRAGAVLDLAEQRLAQLAEGTTPWTRVRGLNVQGYYSSVDGSPQPYGLVMPDDHDFESAAPLYVWLHGRGDKTTDLHFIHGRLNSVGQISPRGAIVLHPFGRQCIGYKSAGEIDVLEAIADVQSRYKIDPDRIVLMGFSMGGAGAWHIGAHYADRFVAVSPGAGFAETARYQRLQPEDYPPRYEQTLWGLYDVPNYVRNLFNLPVVVYSGELDKQIQAAHVMEEAFLSEGQQLPHVIGPGMGHKYHPDSLAQIMATMNDAVQAGRNRRPEKLSLQTRTLRYDRMHWAAIERLEKHWSDARVDAEIVGEKKLSVQTTNVAALGLHPWDEMQGAVIEIDGQQLVAKGSSAWLVKSAGDWKLSTESKTGESLAKRHALQGPIDDAFMAPFLVVAPTGRCAHPAVQQWVEFELAHLQDRWPALFRGELPITNDVDVTADDIKNKHLVLFGDPAANQLLRRIASDGRHRLPLDWDDEQVRLAGARGAAANHVPLLVYPNPLNPEKYVVLNSGPTFREAHDRTNSLQNPKLPDWALIDVTQPPDAEAPGKVVAADFFDEYWRFQRADR